MEIDGSGVTQIYGSDSIFISNALASPDNTKIVFYEQDGRDMETITTTEIALMNADGTGYRKLTNNNWMDFQPIWSPNGTEILFISDGGQSAGTDIYVMDTDGNVLRRLTDTPGITEADPDWKCGKIVFTRNGTIWIMDEDGLNQKQLTDPVGRGTDVGVQFTLGDYDPSLSPDCSKVAFERLNGAGYEVDGTRIGDYDLYIYYISDDAYQDISQSQTADLIPEWSSDGTKIVFNHLSNVIDDLYDIFVINADGTGRAKVTGDDPTGFVEEGCTWFGNKILFAAEIFG
jgi:Tol biopolymer transport system component